MSDTEKFFKRTWAEINLDALKHNIDVIKSNISDTTEIMAVVKADCYGHGMKYFLPELETLGCGFYAVSNIEEALDVRRYTDKPILILGYTPAVYADLLSKNNISQTVFSLDYANSLSKTASAPVKIHIKIDTGMQRLGFCYCDSPMDESAIGDIVKVCKLQNLHPEGIFTHFAESDNKKETDDFTDKQFSRFTEIIDLLKKENITFKYRHCANSAAILTHHEKQLDAVRAGIIIYGLYPSVDMMKDFDIRPVMSLKSIVSMVKTVPSGQTIGYGRTYKAEKDLKIATVPVGYADGYPRHLSNKGYVIINGKKANIVGNVCMDQIMVDITDIPDVKLGDEVLLFGESQGNIIPADELAELCGTIGYEIISNLGKRVPLVFCRNGNAENVIDYYNF